MVLMDTSVMESFEEIQERDDGFRGVRYIYIYIVYVMRINIRRKYRDKIQSLIIDDYNSQDWNTIRV